MIKNLLIVESPAKAKTIENYLGKDYKVIASYGHVRDLPKAKLGIDTEHNFEPEYIIPTKAKKQLNQLKKAVEESQNLYLATDLDREGEAIAWHIVEATKPNKAKVRRITFAEITKDALNHAIKNPREINMSLVDAQQARRILDRLVGYKLSPILWKKVKSGLSAGRVQSVALKILVDREKEIKEFKKQEYWTIESTLENSKNQKFSATLEKIDNKKIEITNHTQANELADDLGKQKFLIDKIDKKQLKSYPLPPFITSTLSQQAYQKLGFSTKKTMTLAQRLYENGYITYMRTDSTNLSTQALGQIKRFIVAKFGDKYGLSSPRIFKKKSKNAQEAHEAIRPTDFNKYPESLEKKLEKDQFRLYRLIFNRTVASQMTEMISEKTTAKILAKNYTLIARGTTEIFDGFYKIWPPAKGSQTQVLPTLSEKEQLKLIEIIPSQHFTQPPPRYSEASLIKKLEAEGIGRPSTYAPTISTLVYRGYVISEDKKLVPQQIGVIVNEMLEKNFTFVVNPKFTAQMESELDNIAQGKLKWQPVVEEFYRPMDKLLEEKAEKIEKVALPVVKANEKCEKCGAEMLIKSGRFGQFMACSAFPECKNTKPIIKTTGMKCPDCKKGEIIERKTKKGRIFYGCNKYPDCKYASWKKPDKNN